jgi:hypothetical protein
VDVTWLARPPTCDAVSEPLELPWLCCEPEDCDWPLPELLDPDEGDPPPCEAVGFAPPAT